MLNIFLVTSREAERIFGEAWGSDFPGELRTCISSVGFRLIAAWAIHYAAEHRDLER